MLTQLVIQHLALIEHLDLQFHEGLTVISGESGAGKSILMGALNWLAGARSSGQKIQAGHHQARVSGEFSLKKHQKVQQWLASQDFLDADNPEVLIIQRSLNREGRSQIRINGQLATVTILKQLGQQLLSYHSQKAQHALGDSAQMLSLLDSLHGERVLLDEVRQAFALKQQCYHHWQQLLQQSQQMDAEQRLLDYQLLELQELSPLENEWAVLEAEHVRLSHADHNHAQVIEALLLCGAAWEDSRSLGRLDQPADPRQQRSVVDKDARAQLLSIEAALASIEDPGAALANLQLLAKQSLTLLDELTLELQEYLQTREVEPERLLWLEQRLTLWQALAKKHRCLPEDLPKHWVSLQTRIEHLQQQPEQVQRAEQAYYQADKAYLTQAQALSVARQRGCQHLLSQLRQRLEKLDLPHLQVDIRLSTKTATAAGIDDVAVWVQTNPGQPISPLQEVASGGEVARLFLALETLGAEHLNQSVLVFDEVDIGIGGGTAARMGQLLRELANYRQVFCITHQPQVTALGKHHLYVKKTIAAVSKTQQAPDKQKDSDKTPSQPSTTFTLAKYLKDDERLEELTRMLGGFGKHTATQAHAEALLWPKGRTNPSLYSSFKVQDGVQVQDGVKARHRNKARIPLLGEVL